MMKKVWGTLLTVLVLLAGSCRLGEFSATQSPDAAARGLKSANVGYPTLDVDVQLLARERDRGIRAAMDAEILAADPSAALAAGGASRSVSLAPVPIGTVKTWLATNTVTGGVYYKSYTLRSIGAKSEIWVANSLAYPAGDPRPVPVVNTSDLDKLRDEFDANIYAVDSDFFGTPDSHVGANAMLGPSGYYAPIDGQERVVILVDNVRDENYYDPTYPFFVMGFFSPTFERYLDRNIITIDTLRLSEWLSGYYGTIAHEFQHLIHSDNDPLEEHFINEGMADFAQYLCGYGHSWGHVNFFLQHPENSLVVWDEHVSAPTGPETLSDYGQAYLLMLYLNDHYGKDFIRHLAKSELHGIESVNEALASAGAGIDFGELFRRFSVAVAIDSAQPGDGAYEFKSIDVNVNWEQALAFDKDGVPAWGGDYKVLPDKMNKNRLVVDGVEYGALPWAVAADPAGSGSTVLWGGQGDELDNKLIFAADLSNVASATLSFETLYNIEEQWDFGIVQVSTDSGATWTSLANAHTRSDLVPEGYPGIRDALPGFTGMTDGWTTESFDLSAYAGRKIHVSFSYMTDWGYNEAGWYVRNLSIPEIGYGDPCASADGFMSRDKLAGVKIPYALTFINRKSQGLGNAIRVLDVDPFSITDDQAIALKQHFFGSGSNYMITWYAAPIGKTEPAPFTYAVIPKNEFAKIK